MSILFTAGLLIVFFFLSLRAAPREKAEDVHIHGAGQVGLLAALALFGVDYFTSYFYATSEMMHALHPYGLEHLAYFAVMVIGMANLVFGGLYMYSLGVFSEGGGSFTAALRYLGPSLSLIVAFVLLQDYIFTIVVSTLSGVDQLLALRQSIARQLGLDEAALVKAIAEGWAALKGPASDAQGAVERSKGQLPPEPLPPPAAEGFEIEDFVRRAWHDIWNRRMFSEIFRLYAPTFECHSASGREMYGHNDAMQFVLDWLAAFPDARMFIDHVAVQGSAEAGYRVAVRWTLLSTHEGHGIYGRPTGKRVRILGISHQHVRDGKFVAEWTVFDELLYSCRMFEDIRFAFLTISTSSMCVGVIETGVMSRNSHTKKYNEEGTAIFKARLVATASWNIVLRDLFYTLYTHNQDVIPLVLRHENLYEKMSSYRVSCQ